MPMKTIIVATDFSDYSKNAMKAAASIAKKTGANVTLLHCIYVDSRWTSMSDDAKQKHPETLSKIAKAESQLKQILEQSLFRGIKVEYMISFGVPYTEIIDIAKRKKADLIVIGSHGNEGSERFFIGSNIQKVLRHADCPVLTIKKGIDFKNWKKLVFASNLYEKIEKQFLQIGKLSKALDFTIYLVVVNRPSEFITTREGHKKMDDFIAKYPDLKIQKALYCHNSIEDGVMEYAEDIDADWIAMGTHNRKWKPGYLIGNTETLVYRAVIPVLSVNI